MQNTFNVICTGDLMSGFSQQQAISKMAELFKIPSEQAEKYIGARRTIKSKLDAAKAELYKQKIEHAGLTVELVAVEPPKPSLSLVPLALEPMEGEPEPAPAKVEHSTKQSPAKAKSNSITCPKCGLEQTKVEQCGGCGVFINKVLAAQNQQNEKAPARRTQPETDEPAEHEPADEIVQEGIALPAIGAAIAAALAGAYLWKFIAVTFNFELGIIAWGIGGLIGFAVAAMQARGMAAGVLCGALALFAIMGGKYMTVSAFQNELVDMIKGYIPEDELVQTYNEELNAAQYYVANVVTETEIKEYMVEQYLTESDTVEGVTDEELQEFKLHYEPLIIELANNPPGAEQWVESTLGSDSESFSTWDLVKEDFGFLDFVFLFLGIGTAFRLGRGAEY